MTFSERKALEATTRFKQAGDTLRFDAGNNLIVQFSGAAKNTTSNGNSNNNSDNENTSVVKPEDKRWILKAIAGKPLPKLEKESFPVFDKQKSSAGKQI